MTQVEKMILVASSFSLLLSMFSWLVLPSSKSVSPSFKKLCLLNTVTFWIPIAYFQVKLRPVLETLMVSQPDFYLIQPNRSKAVSTSTYY